MKYNHPNDYFCDTDTKLLSSISICMIESLLGVIPDQSTS